MPRLRLLLDFIYINNLPDLHRKGSRSMDIHGGLLDTPHVPLYILLGWAKVK